MINHCYRVFMKRATFIQQNVKTTEMFGGSSIFATLSLRFSPTIASPLYTARAGV